MTRIEALKLPRSGLTETMRSLGAQPARVQEARPPPQRMPGDLFPTDIQKSGIPRTEFPNLRQWRSGSGISSEIQQILGSGRATSSTMSPIFGCSPPSRALNPLSQDSNFKSTSSIPANVQYCSAGPRFATQKHL